MEKNCTILSVYKSNKDRIYRCFYIVYKGIYTPIKSESTLDFINQNLKDCNVYAYEEFIKVLKGELSLDDLKTITYKEYKSVYCGV